MKRLLLISLSFCVCLVVAAQRGKYSKIIITISDTSDLKQKVKEAFIQTNLIVKEIRSADTIYSYPKEISVPGYLVVKAVIHENTIAIDGVYSFNKLNTSGYERQNAKLKPITSFNNNERWKVVNKIASLIPGEKRYQ